MKKYKVVVGYYPSNNSALKVVEKVNHILSGVRTNLKEKVKEATIITTEDCYIVLLYETDNFNIADNVFSECMKHNIYCGIDVSKWKCID